MQNLGKGAEAESWHILLMTQGTFCVCFANRKRRYESPRCWNRRQGVCICAAGISSNIPYSYYIYRTRNSMSASSSCVPNRPKNCTCDAVSSKSLHRMGNEHRKNLFVSPFTEDLLNDTTYRKIHLDEHYHFISTSIHFWILKHKNGYKCLNARFKENISIKSPKRMQVILTYANHTKVWNHPYECKSS